MRKIDFARIVFEEWSGFELVDWEATVRHGYPLETLDRWREAGDDRAEFYHAITGRVRDFVQRPGEFGEMRAADALALIVVVEPDIVTEAHDRFALVETDGQLRGVTWVDWNDRLGHTPNCQVVNRVDLDRFLTLMARAVGVS